LQVVLEDARRWGFLGPGDVGPHIDHALDFASILQALAAERIVDLGSGGGLPGMVIGAALPAVTLVLVDAHQRRTTFLRQVVDGFGWADRVEVVAARAEEFGRAAARRAAFDAVVARSFGLPAVTAECAAPLLRTGGHLVVSEPPHAGGDRWPADDLAVLGLRRVEPPADMSLGHHFAVLRADAPCPDRFPRRTGVPARRPLFVPRET
jgi:16S rRNA (guanine527-N7)-methyltransferase